MPEPTPQYYREFFRSPHHAWWGLLTLGAGFVSGQPLYLLAGATAYVLGWIYLPGMSFFRRHVEGKKQTAEQASAQAEVSQFNERRQTLLTSLTSRGRGRYAAIAQVCQDIEQAGADNPLADRTSGSDPLLRKLEEMMWTYLRLLGIEEPLERFLETERREEIPRLVSEAEREAEDLAKDLDRLKKVGSSPLLETKERLLASRVERLEVLRKRLQRIEQAQANHALVLAEQERLDQQLKLLRADAVTSKNMQSLSARIDATVENLTQTNRWLAELDEFKDWVGDLPQTEMRVGYATTAPPPISQAPRQSAAHRTGRQ